MKDKLIHFYIPDKFVFPLRILAFLVSIPFIIKIYNIIDTGYAESRYISGNDGEYNYYSVLIGDLLYAFAFIWLSLGGIRKKSAKPPANE